jgi:plastocyanin
MDDYRFEPDTLQLETYDVIVLKFINRGTVPHGFAAGELVSAEEDGFNRSMFEGVEVRKTVGSQTMTTIPENSGQLHDAIITLGAEETGRLVFSLPNKNAGVWWFGCFENLDTKSHYQLGMKGLVLVEPE